ncbi:MAG TPA: acyl-CoA thioesterase II [Acidimicrobiales bacterium]|nr:acyl-CoA thioesterase II [Acidimicrobiales bacterium]
MSQAAVDDLVRVLDLEPIEVNIFRGMSPDEDRQRIFGGQVAGQALVAAARTVPDDREVHSLHGYFLRAGDPRVPVLYEVDRLRDGGSFTTRRVVAIQHGRVIFNMAASFQVPEEGFDHAFPMPDLPPPEDLPTLRERLQRAGVPLTPWLSRDRPIDIRHVDPGGPGSTPEELRRPRDPHHHVWLRADGRLPDDPIVHTVVLTYASDMTLLDTSLIPHGGSWSDPSVFMASLDHAMWFHRPFRADDWLLYAQDSPDASGGRGLSRGLVFTRNGTLVATVIQEGLIRKLR